MASGEAEPLQYTTTVLRVSIHCEGCKKKVKKVLHSIEGVYKVTIDATQHKVTVTGSVAADALVRRLLKSGKHAALWPVPAPAPPATEAKKPEEAPSAGKGGKGAEKADAKPKKDHLKKDGRWSTLVAEDSGIPLVPNGPGDEHSDIILGMLVKVDLIHEHPKREELVNVGSGDGRVNLDLQYPCIPFKGLTHLPILSPGGTED
ncbi:hypothetical protein TRIUR3_17510 [Triticum urartu]|uniref:HMA domain-containing protein n=2 Tax=Triticum TaxID=4564 RepID=A0A9R1NKJ5_TRITD|nr:hypothetical protein TRIUR3_17510 [Triticum urartu]VAH26656.1 unnamed protein product [Triticum turgidum subsp. durum]